MRRRARILAALILPAMLLAAIPSVAGASVIEDYARVIRSRHASAAFMQVDGCRQVEVFVSAMDAKYGSLHGTINKQGLVGVSYLERDVCAEPGPKGFPVVYSADGMSLDHLGSTAKFGSAWVNSSLQGSDGDGNPIEIGINMHWAPVEAYERSRVSGNGWFPAAGQRGAQLHTFSHGLRAAATAWGEVTIGGQALSLSPTLDASLEQIRYFCQVIQHPHGGFDVDC
ncbi:MAG TPA: hypothetical protein VES36_02630 [Candidatus Limnocylindrales bacterium]|nr:hypothetical protein [Candidatus Limnocylindrales bacterium]